MGLQTCLTEFFAIGISLWLLSPLVQSLGPWTSLEMTVEILLEVREACARCESPAMG